MTAQVAVLWVDHVGSDWLGIYVDGDRVYEGHPPPLEDALNFLRITHVQASVSSDSLRVPGVRGLPLRFPKETSR